LFLLFSFSTKTMQTGNAGRPGDATERDGKPGFWSGPHLGKDGRGAVGILT